MSDQPAVTLRDITRANWRACVALTPAPAQEHFVASNAVSLAQAAYEPGWTPQGIYAGEVMVGFIMYGLTAEDPAHWVLRLMVVQRHQRQGYGHAALAEAIQRMTARPDCHEIAISYEFDNEVARALYLSLGFRETGETIEDETVARLAVVRDGAKS
jgi:diamine N-acetyltransferase